MIKKFEKPDKLNGVISLFRRSFTKKKIPENKKIKGDRFSKIVGVFIKVSMNIFIKKLPVISFSLKKITSSIYVDSNIKDKNIPKKINSEKENSLIK